MRILITTPWLGGAGGVERLVQEVCRALPDDHVDVVYRLHLGGELAELRASVTTRGGRSLRFRGSNSANRLVRSTVRRLIDPLRRRWSRYDIELALSGGPKVNDAVHARLRLFDACGAFTSMPEGFDLLWREAPTSDRQRREDQACIVLPPPLAVDPGATQPVDGIPDRFLLTVFNPYGEVKGIADLERIIDTLPLPLVWCHSRATVEFTLPDTLLDHPNIVHFDQLGSAERRWLYQRADAYLCFSRTESFGYAIADALAYSRAVVSRRVGVLSYPEAVHDSVFLVDDEWAFDWSLLDTVPLGPPDRDVSFMAPERFRSALLALLEPRAT